MYWQQETDSDSYQVPEDVVDLQFKITCPRIPVDHGRALGEALSEVLPWLGEEPLAGVHNLHGAESGNGWERPSDAREVVYLSKRTPLVLRLPAGRTHAARSLSGTYHSVRGHPLQIGEPKQRLLSKAGTLYARHVLGPAGADEDAFQQWAIAQLRALPVVFSKILCGRSHRIDTPSGERLSWSLMVAGLSPPDAVRLQQQGLGPYREFGCGLFIPYKAV